MKKHVMIILVILSLNLSACSINPLASDEDADVAASSPSSEKEMEKKDQPSFKSGENQTTDQQSNEKGTKDKKGAVTEKEDKSKNQKGDQSSKEGLTVVDNPKSIQVVVNKQRKLPDGYTPPDLVVPDVPFYFDKNLPKKHMRKEAAQALEKLFAGAEKAGHDLVAASGYRSYERQKRIFNDYAEKYGEEKANTFSAKPGTSEHQTGLAMDVTSAAMSFKLDQSFRQTGEGEWLANHAHEYGFVIRYPKGKDEITGYTYEPWHLRYVGKDISTNIHNQELTLEEFFGLHPSAE